MKKFIIIFFLIFKFKKYLSAYSSDPKDFISELINETITVLSNKTLTQDEKSIFIEKIALENVDIKGLSLYTLGEIRKTIDKPQLKRFQISFEKYFLKTPISRLSDYSGSKFEVINADIKVQIIQLLIQSSHLKMEDQK